MSPGYVYNGESAMEVGERLGEYDEWCGLTQRYEPDPDEQRDDELDRESVIVIQPEEIHPEAVRTWFADQDQ